MPARGTDRRGGARGPRDRDGMQRHHGGGVDAITRLSRRRQCRHGSWSWLMVAAAFASLRGGARRQRSASPRRRTATIVRPGITVLLTDSAAAARRQTRRAAHQPDWCRRTRNERHSTSSYAPAERALVPRRAEGPREALGRDEGHDWWRSSRPSMAFAERRTGPISRVVATQRTGLPVYSLYGATRSRRRTVRCAILDVLVIDLQDLGTRYVDVRRRPWCTRCGGAARTS